MDIEVFEIRTTRASAPVHRRGGMQKANRMPFRGSGDRTGST